MWIELTGGLTTTLLNTDTVIAIRTPRVKRGEDEAEALLIRAMHTNEELVVLYESAEARDSDYYKIQRALDGQPDNKNAFERQLVNEVAEITSAIRSVRR